MVVAEIRELILKHIPAGYEESMNWGMISYEVPLSVYPNTYNKQPLMYAALATQKHYYSLYLMGIYAGGDGVERLRDGFEAAGKKLNMGKSCIRFKRLEDLPLRVIAKEVSSLGVPGFITLYEKALLSGRKSC